MADIRNIFLTKKAQSANISTTSITTNVNVPSVVANIPDVANPGLMIETDTRINVELSGYGEESISQPGLIKYAQDLIISIDVAKRGLGKILIDNFVNSEIFSKHINAIKSDTTTISDAFSRIVYYRRDFEDVIDATDDFYVNKTLGKIASDNFSNTDQSVLLFNKTTNENTAVNELFRVETSRISSDIISISEIFSRVFVVIRDFADLVNTTDDFYGLANVDDDQTARIDKVVIDFGILTESVSNVATFIRSFADIASTSDEFRKSTSKIFSDQISGNDILTKSYEKVSTETVSFSQTLSINIQSYFQADYVESGYTGQNYTY